MSPQTAQFLLHPLTPRVLARSEPPTVHPPAPDDQQPGPHAIPFTRRGRHRLPIPRRTGAWD